MRHTADADELLKILRYELRTIVRDDPRRSIGENQVLCALPSFESQPLGRPRVFAHLLNPSVSAVVIIIGKTNTITSNYFPELA